MAAPVSSCVQSRRDGVVRLQSGVVATRVARIQDSLALEARRPPPPSSRVQLSLATHSDCAESAVS